MTEKIYPISLSPNYCKDWDINQALRELVQNMVDSGGGDIDYDSGTKTLTIVNYDNQIPEQYMLLGEGSKSTSDGNRGGFNEGAKIAWLILTRHGHEVVIENGDVLWTPYYAHSELFGTDMLHVSETPLENNNDVRYIISNIEQETYDEMCKRCLFLVDNLEIVEETYYGNILENQDDQGKLFCGGLYVCDTDMDYTYDIKPEHLKLNRDRKQAVDWDLKGTIRFMWDSAKDKTKAADLLFNKATDACHFNNDWSGSNKEVVEACYEKSVEEYGEGVVLADSDSDKQDLIAEGYRNVVVSGNSSFNEVVRRSQTYRDTIEIEETEEFTPIEIMEMFLEKYSTELKDQQHEDFSKMLELFIDKSVECGYSERIFEQDVPFERGE